MYRFSVAQTKNQKGILPVHFCLDTKTNQKSQEGIKVIFGFPKTAAVAIAACFLFAPQNALPLAPPTITEIYSE